MIETFAVERPPRFTRSQMAAAGLFALLLLPLLLWWQTKPPGDFPVGSAIVIPRGLSAAEIADHLESQRAVRSNLFLYLILVWQHDPSNIQAGTFLFDRPLSVFAVAEHITTLGATENLVVLTLPEGYTAAEFAMLTSDNLPDFSSEKFRELTDDDEGYLFPDTYYLPADFTAEELERLLLDTFEQKTVNLRQTMRAHPLGEYGVITLASLIEREANTPESMRLVSGILHNRLDEGIRLQVDASVEYVLERPLNTLTPNDLETDSPYNTYLYGGLPPTPIGNPGLTSINAVLEPTESNYFYYITDSEGDFYYAETFEEHRQNIERYLR